MSIKPKGLTCPYCKSSSVWKDGIRYTRNGEVQRYICRSCGFRFSESTTNSHVKVNVARQVLKESDSGENFPEPNILQSDLPFQPFTENPSFQSSENVGSHRTSKVTIVEKGLNRFRDYNSERRVCVSEREAKNLAEVESRIEKLAAGATKLDQADIKGKVINFAWWLKKEGYAEATIRLYTGTIEVLAKRGANIYNSESVKEVIARQEWSNSRRRNAIAAYTIFLKMHGRTWEPPMCHVTRKLPFLPTEEEIDALIAGCGKKTATFLQLLKETAMRSGEANRLEWTSIDTVNRTITLNNPEKNSNPRIFKVNSKLVDMLNALPKTSQRVFGDVDVRAKKATFYRSRKLLAEKLQNPRLLRIHFHTLRHWKATMLYHQTKDVLYVKNFLGHKRIDNTLLYIQLAEVIFKETTDEYISKVTTTVKEACDLIEAGFEYVTDMDGVKIFRKRK